MNREKQVVSLELAKKLKELGVEQESYFSWCKAIDDEGLDLWERPLSDADILDWKEYFEVENDGNLEMIASAYTASELLEILPYFVMLEKEPRTSGRQYSSAYIHKKGGGISAKTPADTLAKMLIYLLENGLVDLEGK